MSHDDVTRTVVACQSEAGVRPARDSCTCCLLCRTRTPLQSVGFRPLETSSEQPTKSKHTRTSHKQTNSCMYGIPQLTSLSKSLVSGTSGSGFDVDAFVFFFSLRLTLQPSTRDASKQDSLSCSVFLPNCQQTVTGGSSLYLRKSHVFFSNQP